MKETHFLAAGVLTAFLLAAPAFAFDQGASGGNPEGEPRNSVRIEIQNDPVDPGAVVIKVSPYLLTMPAQNPNQKIRFTLVSDTFRFPEDANRAIAVENNRGQFSGNAHGQGPDKGRVILINNANTDAELYKYSIEVEGADGRRLTIDPLIKNGG